jgi:hypothetical protein
MKHHTPTIFLVILGLCVFAVSASAQSPSVVTTPQDFFKINYFSNNGVSGAPDATVRIDNPGSPFTVNVGGGTGEGGAVNLCAMFYVFDNDQALSECCGCLVTPDGLRTLSVTQDLTRNPLTGTVSNNGVIVVLSTLPNGAPCDPTGALGPTNLSTADFAPVPTVRAWATHIQNRVSGAYPMTETAFSDVTASPAELELVTEECFFTVRLGSGQGVCGCGTGD